MKRFWTHGVVAFVAAVLGFAVHAFVPGIPAGIVVQGATVILDQTVPDAPDAAALPVALSADTE